MRFALRRAGFFLLTLWAALTLNFLLPRIMPGNPVEAAIASLRVPLTPSEINAIAAQFGINSHQSLISEYFTYLGHTLTGNLGVSFVHFPTPVTTYIATGIWWTLGLIGTTTVLAFLAGTAVGAIAAWRRGSRLDSTIPPLLVFTTAIPIFWVGLMLILVFSTVLGWLPSKGGYSLGATPSFTPSFILDVLQHAILPAIALLITTIGAWVLTMRNTMVGTLTEDYVRMARAKGLPSHRIMVNYAARNAILPNLTGFAMSLGFVVSGAILIEYVFNYPGVGFMLLQAVESNDYPLMQGLFLLITVAVLVCIVLSDIATAILDPRTRTAS
jgi:peptide/nickel transport system permease protein